MTGTGELSAENYPVCDGLFVFVFQLFGWDITSQYTSGSTDTKALAAVTWAVTR